MSSSSSDSSSESDSDTRFLGPTDAFEFEYTFDPAVVTLALLDPPPERSVIPVRPNPPILIPPRDGFFVLATCIFHAEIVPEGTLIRTKQCPSNLRMIAKNNLGCPDGTHRQFMDIMPTIMRNNKTAEDILKESMLTCLSGVRSTCSAFEAAPAPESADPRQLAKMKSEVKLKCQDIEKRIKGVGVNGLTKLKTPKTQPEQLAILFNAHEKGNALTNVVYFGTMLALDDSVLNKTKRLNVERLMSQINYIDYGVPKKNYIPNKTYQLNQPFDFTKTGNAVDNFIDNLYGCLHLAVGLRLDGASYTVQLNVDLRTLKASDTITLDEVVKLLVSPTLARRAVELVCEKHPALDVKKRALIGLSEKKDTWQVALFDHGCSDIRVDGYPELLYTGPEHKTTKKKKGKVVVLSAPAHGSRPSRTQTIRLKKMKHYLTRDEPDELFTTLMKKRKRSDSSSNSSSSNETILPLTPKDELSSSGGSKRRQCKRRQCKRRTQRTQRRRQRCKH
jgi:hypothetical protein